MASVNHPQRVRVYAGTDPVTKKRHNLIDTVTFAGPAIWTACDPGA